MNIQFWISTSIGPLINVVVAQTVVAYIIRKMLDHNDSSKTQFRYRYPLLYAAIAHTEDTVPDVPVNHAVTLFELASSHIVWYSTEHQVEMDKYATTPAQQARAIFKDEFIRSL